MVDDGELECQQIAQLLGDYVEGELPRHQAELLEWHLEGCQPCIAFVRTYKVTIRAAQRQSDLEMPAELRNRLVSFLKASPKANPRP